MAQVQHSPAPRRHPLAFAAYLMVLLIGIIFVTGWLNTGHAEQALFDRLHHVWIYLWEWELVSGGAAGLLAITVRPRLQGLWPDLSDLLHLESIAAFVSAAGITTYVYAVASLVGWRQVGPSATILAALVIGLVLRGSQALRDAYLAQRYARVVDAVKAALPIEAEPDSEG